MAVPIGGGGIGAGGDSSVELWCIPDWIEKRHMRDPVGSREPWRRTFDVSSRMSTACLSYTTLQPRLQRGPIPTRLCWKPGMMCLPRTGKVGNWRLQEAEEVYCVPDEVPTLMGGTAALMSVQGAAGVRHISLAPLSNMAMSVLGRLISPVLRSWGRGLQCKL